jgi:hypothetical protein
MVFVFIFTQRIVMFVSDHDAVVILKGHNNDKKNQLVRCISCCI